MVDGNAAIVGIVPLLFTVANLVVSIYLVIVHVIMALYADAVLASSGNGRAPQERHYSWMPVAHLILLALPVLSHGRVARYALSRIEGHSDTGHHRDAPTVHQRRLFLCNDAPLTLSPAVLIIAM